MQIPMTSQPLPQEMRDVVVDDALKRYEFRYEVMSEDGACIRSHLFQTDSLASFGPLFMRVLLTPEARVLHLRLGKRKATLRWSETMELPDSPI